MMVTEMAPVVESKATSRETSARKVERRGHRRHDMEQAEIVVQQFDHATGQARPCGRLTNLSAGGMRFRAGDIQLRPGQQICVRLELPVYAGISPFIDTTAEEPKPINHWTGWLTATRIARINERQVEIAGEFADMNDLDRGMLGLYLSLQPIA